MTGSQAHRGPDDGGVDVVHPHSPAVVFGHRRLAIIDLSPAGHQPMRDPDTGAWITFNGEIYNYRELRRQLEGRGLRFTTRTDTEVILKAYSHWGEECVRHFRGIFAFAIFVPARGGASAPLPHVFFARDQLGVKPLYYYLGVGGTLLFASEVRSLLMSGLVERSLDLGGLRSYLAYGSVQDPLSLVCGVRSLPPGHTLLWREGYAVVDRYWRLPGPEEVASEAPADLFAQVHEHLAEAVRLQLVADVPLGSFLSGGIDSTAIAALAQREARGPIRTFSVVFDEKTHDERRYARLAAEYIGTDHTELHLSGSSVLGSLDNALAAFDQPSVDGINTYFVSQVTRQAGLTVALSGVGGDELFGGYDGYRKSLLAECWGKRVAVVPRPIRSLVSRLVCRLATNEAQRKAAHLLRNPHAPHLVTRRLLDDPQIDELLLPEIATASAPWEHDVFHRLGAETAGYDPVNRAAAYELQTYMVSTLLRDTDQMSMAHALEVRVPLIDHRLVEYLFRVGGAYKLDPNQPKPLLTRPLDDEIPRECVHRRKRGFELPFAVWLRQDLRPRIRETFLGVNGDHSLPFRGAGLEKLWNQFEAGRLSWSRIWSLFVLRNWLVAHRMTSSTSSA